MDHIVDYLLSFSENFETGQLCVCTEARYVMGHAEESIDGVLAVSR